MKFLTLLAKRIEYVVLSFMSICALSLLKSRNYKHILYCWKWSSLLYTFRNLYIIEFILTIIEIFLTFANRVLNTESFLFKTQAIIWIILFVYRFGSKFCPAGCIVWILMFFESEKFQMKLNFFFNVFRYKNSDKNLLLL